MFKLIKRLILFGTVICAGAAVLEQLQRPKEQRTWHGEAFGIVPYDFRTPSLERFKMRWWNPHDPRLFTPRDFGVGWAINFYRLTHPNGPVTM